MTTLYLTADEQKRFQALPEGVKDGWVVEAETGDQYETKRQLEMRFYMSTLAKDPAVRKLFEEFQSGKDLDQLALPDLSESLASEFFFTIGARGLTLLMAQMFQEGLANDEDLEGVAGLSMIRHKILETNAAVPA